MGGATAQLVTMQMLSSQEYQHVVSIRCVALGSPPVFRTENDIPPNIHGNINIYVNGQDVVPSLSIGSVANLMASLREVDSLGLTMEEKVGVVIGTDGSSEIKKEIKNVMDGVKQDKFPYLQHPGEVIMMTSKGTNVTVMKKMVMKVERMVISLIIDEAMITDHLYANYKEMFSKEVV